jgi:hypothetical protein
MRKMAYRMQQDNLNQTKSLGKEALARLTDSAYSAMKSQHIAEIAHNAKRLGCFSEPVVGKMQKRSLELLRDKSGSLQIHHMTNLLFAFSKDAPPEIKKVKLHHLS